MITTKQVRAIIRKHVPNSGTWQVQKMCELYPMITIATPSLFAVLSNNHR
jgi:hypothetical protein